MAGRDKPASEPVYEMCPCCGRKLALSYNNYFKGKISRPFQIGSTVHIDRKHRCETDINVTGDRMYFCAWCWSMFDKVTGKIYRFGQDVFVPIMYTAPKFEDAHGYSHCRKYMDEQDRLWREGKL